MTPPVIQLAARHARSTLDAAPILLARLMDVFLVLDTRISPLAQRAPPLSIIKLTRRVILRMQGWLANLAQIPTAISWTTRVGRVLPSTRDISLRFHWHLPMMWPFEFARFMYRPRRACRVPCALSCIKTERAWRLTECSIVLQARIWLRFRPAVGMKRTILPAGGIVLPCECRFHSRRVVRLPLTADLRVLAPS